MTRTILLALTLSLVALSPARAAVREEKLNVPLRGHHMDLTLYVPSQATKGTIIMGSGDVGWVGLAVDLSKFLAPQGYVVVGVNVRQYLSAFTTSHGHLTPEQVQEDFNTVAQNLKMRGLLPAPVVAAGVSEGAALAVLLGAGPANHQWLSGVMTMGLPAEAEIAWRWTDFTTWITKKNADEPSFEAKDYIAAVSPLPLWMIQSTKDEYVPASDYRMLMATAREPKRQILIDASNHRFTDKLPELRREVEAGLAWIQAQHASH